MRNKYGKKARLTAFVCAAFVCAAFASCSLPGPEDYLAYEEYPFTVEGKLCSRSGGTEYYSCVISLDVLGEGEGSLTFLSPETLSGVTVRVSQAGAELVYDGMSVPSSYGIAELAERALGYFALKNDEMLSAEVTEIGSLRCNRVCYLTDGEEVTVYINTSDGFPVRAEGISAEDGYTGRQLTIDITSVQKTNQANQ